MSDRYTCDKDDPDIDYIFKFSFSSAVNNPDALRTFSKSITIDAMLLYYYVQIGGVKGIVNTTSKVVSICIGDTGVANAGVEKFIRDNLKLHR